ncbi:MAG: tRNA (adenosine(37)-N6)-threonylcarbamoyltransferase complex ATPase subunit type 1 TsaE [Bacilli bacterium]|nr:tRNA (adenosine(37)-N6)-threonylcarbamoyltransferase complex ATPase subunit type 1 TsaE [Bacilli bacterium]
MEYKLITHSKEDTRALGAFLAPLFKRGDVVLLKGDLGAGKTTFTGGVAKALHIEDHVISPTFNIMKCYVGGDIPLYHIDAYRLEGQNIEIGLDEFIEGDGVCFIEWPQFIEPLIPDERLSITLLNRGEDNREITLESDDPHFAEIITKVKEAF